MSPDFHSKRYLAIAIAIAVLVVGYGLISRMDSTHPAQPDAAADLRFPPIETWDMRQTPDMAIPDLHEPDDLRQPDLSTPDMRKHDLRRPIPRKPEDMSIQVDMTELSEAELYRLYCIKTLGPAHCPKPTKEPKGNGP